MTYFHRRTASSKGRVMVNIRICRFSTTHAIPANDMRASVVEAHKIQSTTARSLGLTYSAARINMIGKAPPALKENYICINHEILL